MSYDQNQREAVRLTCASCGQVYDVTRFSGDPSRYVCVRCRRIAAKASES